MSIKRCTAKISNALTSLDEAKKSPYSEGWDAQKTTYIDACPYPGGSAEYAAWHEGYSDADISDELKASREKLWRKQ